jgi:hypothetical protein
MDEMVGNREADLLQGNGASKAPHGTQYDI